MKNKTFAEFVTKHTDGSQAVSFDAEREISEWKAALRDLYALVDQFVAPYKEAGNVQLELTPLSITEESLGTYTVEKGLLRVGDAKYILNPVGTMLIGSKGRVDLLGPVGNSMLALVKGSGPQIRVTVGNEPHAVDTSLASKDRPWKWKIISNKPPYTYTELNEDNFLSLLMRLAG